MADKAPGNRATEDGPEYYDMDSASSMPKATPSALHQHRSVELKKILLGAASGISLVILGGWLIEPTREYLPSDWSQMKATTAFGVFFSVIAVSSRGGPGARRRRIPGIAAPTLLLIFALMSIASGVWEPARRIEVSLSFGDTASQAGHMSFQTAVFFAMVALSMLVDCASAKAESPNSTVSKVADGLVLTTFLGTLAIISGMMFGAASLFSESTDIRTSRYTAFCMLAISVSTCVRRSWADGYLAPLVGSGGGDRLARGALPMAILLPIGVVGIPSSLHASGLIDEPFSYALSTAAMSTILLVMVGILIRHINSLETNLLAQSVTDHLTTICNRRGFFEFGERLFESRKTQELPLTVLYFDLDGLKTVNDVHGHDVGSEMVTVFAQLLRNVFPKEDVVGRVGGDEFAVVIGNGLQATQQTLAKMLTLANEYPADPRAKWKLAYSVGWATYDPDRDETLDDLVARADQMMYSEKRAKREALKREASKREASKARTSSRTETPPAVELNLIPKLDTGSISATKP